jgi:wyosine [tRNA(Phe)-imidazoG37] synthetase (radical SAM superfamily)
LQQTGHRLTNNEDLFSVAYRAAAAATDAHLSPAMAAVNKARNFDGRARAAALRTWISARRREDPAFDAIEFLEAYLKKYVKDVEALIVLALEYRTAGNKEQSIANINAALSARRYDLYAGEVAVSLAAWANGTEGDDTDEWLAGRRCPLPFSNFDTMPNGDVFVCCGDWLPVPIGNIYKNTAQEIWNSAVADEIRASITDGSYRYCSRLSCADILNRTLPETPRPQPAAEEYRAGPSRIVLSHDNSCNLSCPSCRSEVILAKKEQQDRLNRLLTTVFAPLLKEASIVRISGSGDPFASNHYRSLIKMINHHDYPRLRVDLHTNAQLFDDKAWAELQLSGKVGHVEISIDAATAETYHIVRRGGSFDRLMNNLAFVAKLHEAREIKQLAFSFVVQQQNYREMPEFVELADRFGADFVDFRMILDWGVSSPDEFNRRFIGSPNHPEYEAYLEVLKRPELQRPNVRTPARY